MLNNLWNSIELSGHRNLVVGIILFLCFTIAFLLIGIIIYKADKKK